MTGLFRINQMGKFNIEFGKNLQAFTIDTTILLYF